MTVNIREATAADEAAWRRLWQGYLVFYRETLSEEITATTWKHILDPDFPIFCRLAEKAGEVVGFAVCVVHANTWSTAPVLYLEDLFVSEKQRSGGIGRALIEDLKILCAERGYGRLYWMTEEGNTTARKLYDSISKADGFVRYVVRFPQ